MQAHVACAANGVAEEIEYGDANGTTECDVCIRERVREHFAAATHPLKDERGRQQHHD